MCPVLKTDPISGESLDKTKTAEEARKEEIAVLEAKSKPKRKPRKKKEPVVVEEQIKVNPFTSPNGEIDPQTLIPELSKILAECEKWLETVSAQYKLEKDNSLEKLPIPEKIEYTPSITRASGKESAFNLKNPSILKIKYKNLDEDIVLDRVAISTIDVKELLKDKIKAKKLLEDVVVKMFQNIVEIKKLDPRNKYFGNIVATIKMPSLDENNIVYCREIEGETDMFIEIRMFSDITPKGE